MKKIIFINVLLIWCLSANAQTANVDKGCVPLNVDFSAASQPSYFWDFGNGTNSTLQNPDFIYTSPGIYVVELFQSQGGSKVGELTIEVFEDPIVTLAASEVIGCSPAEIDFTNSVTADPDINITGYLWSFGDGGSSTQESPSHIYNNPGVYTVSLEVQTNYGECNQTIIESELISIDGVSASFTVSGTGECDAPATFTIENNTDVVLGNTYDWDFGNGSESSEINPGPITYSSPGTYTILLTVETDEGCTSTQTRNVVIGNPTINLVTRDTVCYRSIVIIQNNTVADSCRWNYTGGAESTAGTKNLNAIFNMAGLQTINLTCYSGECISDTSFMIFVEDVDASFVVDPMISCSDTIDAQFIANDLTYQSYTYFFENETYPDAITNLEIICPPLLDTIAENKPDSTVVYLQVMSAAGCVSIDSALQIFHKPVARILVDQHQGCAPLTVTFEELLDETEYPTTREWLFDDGSPSVTTDTNPVIHTFTEPGEYYVKVRTEDTMGCRDTSQGVWIRVGEFITPMYTIDQTEICLGDTINVDFLNDDPRIDGLVFETDSHRYDDCWTDKQSSHTFITEPGVFDASFIVDYNGCYNEVTETNLITVNGAKANVSYMINCDTPNDVMVTNESLNATELVWTLDETPISGGDQFIQTIVDAGVYQLTLEASNATDNCPVSRDSVEIHITNLAVDLVLPEVICFNEEYMLDATGSFGVDEDCYAGYTWNLPGIRPRQNNKDTVNHNFPPGIHEVSLIVEDINGCTASTFDTVEVYYIEAAFDAAFDVICESSPIDFTNQSISDNPISDFEWSFGSMEENPSYELPEIMGDSLAITLEITDELGCTASVGNTYALYQPNVRIVLNGSTGICIGEELTFAALGISENGSFFNYEWDLGVFGMETSQSFSLQFEEAGTYPITLFYYEDSTGCSGTDEIAVVVGDKPIASFAATVDGEAYNFDEALCHPKIIEFENTSITNGAGFSSWTFDSQMIQFQNPSYSFDKGVHDIQMIITTPFGCSDTINQQVTLVGPDGDLIALDTEVCFGDELEFSAANLEDVSSISWNLGGGGVATDEENVSITFDEFPEDSIVTVDLILQSTESGCEYIESVDIEVIQVIADFMDTLAVDICALTVSFEDQSMGAASYVWDFGNGQTSTDQNPEVSYLEEGTYTVSLQVMDENNICLNEKTVDYEVTLGDYEISMPNVFSPNGDGRNDEFNVVLPDGFEELVDIREFRVYNRWGTLVYDNNSQTQGWDGNYNGSLAPAEVYSYYIELDVLDCQSFVQKGNLTIVR